MMEQVERGEFQTRIPPWLRRLIKKRERKEPEDSYNKGSDNYNKGGGSSERGTRRQFKEGDRQKRITSGNMGTKCKLGQNEQFKDIFHPGNIKGMDKPMKKDGCMMCIRWHSLGYCFEDCRFKSGHGKLDELEEKSLKNYQSIVRKKREDYKSV